MLSPSSSLLLFCQWFHFDGALFAFRVLFWSPGRILLESFMVFLHHSLKILQMPNLLCRLILRSLLVSHGFSDLKKVISDELIRWLLELTKLNIICEFEEYTKNFIYLVRWTLYSYAHLTEKGGNEQRDDERINPLLFGHLFFMKTKTKASRWNLY